MATILICNTDQGLWTALLMLGVFIFARVSVANEVCRMAARSQTETQPVIRKFQFRAIRGKS